MTPSGCWSCCWSPSTEEHLEILSELAELLSDDALRETLLTATDPAQVYRTLATWEPVRPAA